MTIQKKNTMNFSFRVLCANFDHLQINHCCLKSDSNSRFRSNEGKAKEMINDLECVSEKGWLSFDLHRGSLMLDTVFETRVIFVVICNQWLCYHKNKQQECCGFTGEKIVCPHIWKNSLFRGCEILKEVPTYLIIVRKCGVAR